MRLQTTLDVCRERPCSVLSPCSPRAEEQVYSMPPSMTVSVTMSWKGSCSIEWVHAAVHSLNNFTRDPDTVEMIPPPWLIECTSYCAHAPARREPAHPPAPCPSSPFRFRSFSIFILCSVFIFFFFCAFHVANNRSIFLFHLNKWKCRDTRTHKQSRARKSRQSRAKRQQC